MLHRTMVVDERRIVDFSGNPSAGKQPIQFDFEALFRRGKQPETHNAIEAHARSNTREMRSEKLAYLFEYLPRVAVSSTGDASTGRHFQISAGHNLKSPVRLMTLP